MRLLFDVNHPVQVHLLRHVIAHFQAQGALCRVVARDKDVTLGLLEHYGLEALTLAPLRRGRLGNLVELVQREWALLKLARRLRPDLIVGTSVHAARVGRLVGAASIVINDDDALAVPLFARLAYPLATRIVTPECLRHEAYGARHLTYAANQQLFYLHPRRFTPDPAVRAELGLRAEERFVLVRLSALDAHHDRGVSGLGLPFLQELRRGLPGVRVFVSSEKPLPEELRELQLHLPPERMHHALAAAEALVADSQSVSAEAAVLGTPALRLNGFVGRISYLAELEQRELAYGFGPGQERELLGRLFALLADPARRATFAARREKLLSEMIDPLPWLIAVLEREAEARG